jgi:transposase InsO family protein
LPKGANSKSTSVHLNTLAGPTKVTQEVTLAGVCFPEFSLTRRLDKEITAILSSHTGSYDVILGNDVLVPAGFDILGSTQTIQWHDVSVPWQPRSYFHKESSMAEAVNNFFAPSIVESFSTQKSVHEILEAKYDKVSTNDVAQQQKHLPQRQKDQLAALLADFTKLFSGKLGCYPHTKVHLELIPEATHFHTRPYSVPQVHKQVFQKELNRLVEIGVLSPTGPAAYLSPTFIIPKKDGRVRWVSDFRKLNSMILRKVYTLPRIHDILKKRNGYQYFTKLDVSMQYYTFELDEPSKELCTICTPFGNYRYNRLPMGIKQSPDIAQQVMEDLFRNCDEVDVYIDDIGIFSNSWADHLTSLHKVLTILQDNNFTVNPSKCEWAVQETDWLGYWLTPTGLKPWKKKVQAILSLQAPTSIKELRSFIGAVTFYRDMFPKRSHILAPLTAQVGKRNLTWTPECDQAFQAIKAMLAKDAFIRYPDHNKPFHIYTDASDFQLGAVIMQDGAPVAFYSRKLNSAQRNYTTGEKELLSIVETLREYRNMLFGCRELHVYTDHKNITFSNLQTQRVLRWRLFLEEFAPTFHYIKGELNTLADALSRLPFSERQNNTSISQSQKPSDVARQRINEVVPANVQDSSLPGSYFSMAIDDDDLLDCFVHLPGQQNIPFRMDYQTIAEAQAQDAALLQHAEKEPTKIGQQLLAPNVHVYCYVPQPGAPWKIYLPTSLLTDIVRWYHLALGHAGISRLVDTLRMHCFHPRLQQVCEQEVGRCDPCQRHKNVGRGHGETATREATVLPWRDVAVDLIGPWTLTVGGQKHKFHALTIIDMVTNLVEVVRIDNTTAANVALHFENTWLARYPRPLFCIHDPGSEFLGHDFQFMLDRHGIQARPTTAKNPQANSVCERMHQSIGNSLRVLSTMNPPAGIQHPHQILDTAIANAMYATRCTYHSALQTTPGGLAFGRDMILNIPLVTDLTLLQERRQQLIDQRLIAANAKRFHYDYRIGDEVLKLTYNPNKLDPRATGPYPVEQVHANGTLSIRITPTVIERISLRRVKPYRR